MKFCIFVQATLLEHIVKPFKHVQGSGFTAILFGIFRDTVEFKEIIIQLLYGDLKYKFCNSAATAVNQGP